VAAARTRHTGWVREAMRFDAGIVVPLVILVAAAAVAAWLLTGTWLVSGRDNAAPVESLPAVAAAPER